MKIDQTYFDKLLIVSIVLLLLVFFQNCSTSRRLSKLEKKQQVILNKIDSIPSTDEVKTMLVIEGLKSEKRMIQATDRTMLDVNRQTAIDEELKKMELINK